MTLFSSSTVPSRRGQALTWWSSLALALLGLSVSAYLTWIKVSGNIASCGGVGDCESVNSSRYAAIGGIPVALLGALGYLVVLALLAAERRWPGQNETLRMGVFGVALIGTLYSAYLTYIEVAVLRAICPYCVISAVAMTAILVLSILRLRAADSSA